MPRLLTRFGIVWRHPEHSRFAPAEPVNLSITGACLRLDESLVKGQSIILQIALDEGMPPIDVSAKVAWVRQVSACNVFYVGLGFLDISSDNQKLIQEFEKANADNLLRFLSEFPLFGDLTVEDCQTLIKSITLRALDKKAILYHQGQRDDDMQGLFIVQSGLLNIFKGPNPDPKRQLAVVSPGQIFGETTLVTDQPHSATIQAVNPSVLIQISKLGFGIIRTHHPVLALKIMEVVARTLSARLGRTTNMLFAPVH